MNRTELKQWVKTHDSAFQGFQAWMESGDTASVMQRFDWWSDILKDVSLEQARAASRTMLGSDTRPKFFSDHLDWLQGRFKPKALGNSAQSIRIIKCEMCNGTGIVSVVFFSRRFTEGGCPLPDNKGPAACKCSRGIWLNDRRGQHPDDRQLPKFDPDEMRLDIPEPLTPEQRELLMRRLKHRNPLLHAVITRTDKRMAEQYAAEQRSA